MKRGHKIRIYPTRQQAAMLRSHADGSRFVYNWGLSTWREWYKAYQDGKVPDKPNWVKLSRKWTECRPDWASSIPRTVVYYALKDLNSAYVNYFKGIAHAPVFKKKSSGETAFHVACDKFRIRKDGRHVHIPCAGKQIRMAEKLRLQGHILNCTVSSQAGRWYVGILVEVQDTRTAPASVCGVDVGIKNPAVCSDGSTLKLPDEVIARLEERHRRVQRRISRAKPGSHRRYKALIRKRRILERINNIRRDAIHKFTSSVCKNHATVVIEGLNMRGVFDKPKDIRRVLVSSCMAETLRQLRYKAINIVTADRWYPSTQLCSACGARKKLGLKQRVYHCDSCGAELDRDLNAAINLSKYPGSPG